MIKTKVKDGTITRFKGSARAVMVMQFFDDNNNDEDKLVYTGMGDIKRDLLTTMTYLRASVEQLVTDPKERLALIAAMGMELLDGVYEKDEEQGD